MNTDNKCFGEYKRHSLWLKTSFLYWVMNKQEGKDGPVLLTWLPDGLLVQKKKFKTNFQVGGHLGFQIRTILATFDLQVTSILPKKFRVSCPLYTGENVQNRFSTWLLGRQSWISNQNYFSYFWSTSHPGTSYQVSSQWAFLFRRSSST